MVLEEPKPFEAKDLGWRGLCDLFKKLSIFLSSYHKRQLVMVSLWACASSILEMLVAAASVPYIDCLSGKVPVWITDVSDIVGLRTVPAISLGLFVLITAKLIAHAGFSWSAADFNQQVQRDTISRLLDAYLHLEWIAFKSKPRAHYFRRCATTAVDAAFVSYQSVTMISSGLMLIFMIVLMICRSPWVSGCMIGGFLILNVFVQHLVGRVQNRYAHEREAALRRWNHGMAESFESFREIRVYGLETFFMSHLNQSINSLAYANKRLTFFPVLPRLILDFVLFGTLLIVVSIWIFLQWPLSDLIPQLIFYAIVARAIFPALINLLGTRAVLFGSLVNIELVLDEFEDATSKRSETVGIVPMMSEKPFFAMENVTFRHAEHPKAVLKEANMKIDHPSWVAIIGGSGSGKTTLVELLCGIYTPDEGKVVHAWPLGATDQSKPKMAYLPQHVALLDDTIRENVIFGFDKGENHRVDTALFLVSLSETVDALPMGRQTRVGADGGCLSGGERQRLALARALYRNPDMLLLDEATSGLDEPTEFRIMSLLRQQFPNMTVVFISHRSRNLCFADRIFCLRDGRLEDVRKN